MTVQTSYGSVFASLRDAAPEPWRAYTRHAFVEGLRDGTLPKAAFIHYLIQDYVFLVHFSRAWALAVVKADTLEEMKICSATVNALVNDEMQLHVKTCAELGISEDQLFTAVEESENLAYTRYVLEAGYSGDFLDLMAALAPCVMGYGAIGERLGKECTSDTYQDWINTYADPEYQELCVMVGDMIDTAVRSRLGSDYENSPRWNALIKRFATATQLEVSFWDMGLRGA